MQILWFRGLISFLSNPLWVGWPIQMKWLFTLSQVLTERLWTSWSIFRSSLDFGTQGVDTFCSNSLRIVCFRPRRLESCRSATAGGAQPKNASISFNFWRCASFQAWAPWGCRSLASSSGNPATNRRPAGSNQYRTQSHCARTDRNYAWFPMIGWDLQAGIDSSRFLAQGNCTL